MTNNIRVIPAYPGGPYATAALAIAASVALYNTEVASIETGTGNNAVTVIDITTVLFYNTAQSEWYAACYGLCQYTSIP